MADMLADNAAQGTRTKKNTGGKGAVVSGVSIYTADSAENATAWHGFVDHDLHFPRLLRESLLQCREVAERDVTVAVDIKARIWIGIDP
ncbi:MAG: hypothetical protein IH987_05085 [Planctomycetes bacterium]|nr:hypothetical protein [Planctomycetota bacterium]